MRNLIFKITIAFLIALVNCTCPPIVKFYKEIGCTVAEEGTNECPISFECKTASDYEEDKCYYGNKSYDDEEKLEDEETLTTCAVDCVCDNFVSPALFTCSAIDCDIDFTTPKEDCIRLYNEKACCATEELCDREKIDTLATCHLDNKEYREGERMFPAENSCYKCLCSADFDNSTIVDNKDCLQLGCGIQLRKLSKVREGCIPIYYGERCCPIDWRCPDDQENIVEVSTEEIDDTTAKECSFGSVTMSVGSKLSSKNTDIECKCEVPPMPHCVLKQWTFTFPENTSKATAESESSTDNEGEVVSEPENAAEVDPSMESESSPDAETESESQD